MSRRTQTLPLHYAAPLLLGVLVLGWVALSNAINSQNPPAVQPVAANLAGHAPVDGLRGHSPVVAPYRNCAQARAAGAAPVYEGQPGYAPWLDADNDGIGCEPYPR